MGHETHQRGVPFVHDLREGCGVRAHANWLNVELLDSFIGHPEEEGSVVFLFEQLGFDTKGAEVRWGLREIRTYRMSTFDIRRRTN